VREEKQHLIPVDRQSGCFGEDKNLLSLHPQLIPNTNNKLRKEKVTHINQQFQFQYVLVEARTVTKLQAG
jgi:hypothetical protein